MRLIRLLGWLAAAGLVGGLAANLSMPALLAGSLDPMTSIHKYWYVGRASGFVAFGLLFVSVAMGLAVSSRIFNGLLARPWVFEMHQFLSLIVLIAMLFHAMILLPDPYAQFRVDELLIPFASRYRPVPVEIGVIVLYGSAIISTTFYIKRFLGHRTWRAVHYSTFALFVAALVHGMLAGTDSQELWAQLAYLSSGLAALLLTLYRILASKQPSRSGKPASRCCLTLPRKVNGISVAADLRVGRSGPETADSEVGRYDHRGDLAL